MRDTTGRQLFDYWNAMRTGRPAPARLEIDPTRIGTLLPETFILECGRLPGFRFRLAGADMCCLFGRQLRGHDFSGLWREEDREAVRSLLGAVTRESAVAAIWLDGYAGDRTPARFEIVLLPLIHQGTAVNRIMGSFAALDAPAWLGTAPLTRLAVRALDLDWPALWESPATRQTFFSRSPAASSGSARRRFRVIEGGLSGDGAGRRSTGARSQRARTGRARP